MKVLIVDPSRAVTFTLAALFGKNGFDYCATRTGAEALGLLSRETVDVLCFAYELADMNGIEFIVAARARKLGLLVWPAGRRIHRCRPRAETGARPALPAAGIVPARPDRLQGALGGGDRMLLEAGPREAGTVR